MSKEMWANVGAWMFKNPKESNEFLNRVTTYMFFASAIIWIPVGVIIGCSL